MKQVFKKKDRSINCNKSFWKSSGYPETTEDALRHFDSKVSWFFNVPEIYTNVVWNDNITGFEYSGTASILGENTITVIAKDENGCYSNDTVILKVVDCTSLEEFLANTTIHPNPTTGEFIIQHQSVNDDIQQIKVVDLQGRLIEQRKVDYINGILYEKFNLSDLSSGIYLIELLGKKVKTQKKVILY